MITELGKFLREKRSQNNETIKDLSDYLGVSMAFISSVEKGKKTLPFKYIDKIIEKYSLNSKEIEQLNYAYKSSIYHLEINLLNANNNQRILALDLYNCLNDLSDEKIAKIKKIIKE